MDIFTQKRMIRFIDDFRKQSGQLPTLRDFDNAGFDRRQVDLCVKEEILEQLYVTLSNGTIVKGYKIKNI